MMQANIERESDIGDTIKRFREENVKKPQQELDLQVSYYVARTILTDKFLSSKVGW